MINKNQISTEDYEICSKLKSMRFSGMAEALEEVFADPNAELLPFREKIQRIVESALFQETESFYQKGNLEISRC